MRHDGKRLLPHDIISKTTVHNFIWSSNKGNRLHFAHLDHDKGIDLDAGNGGEDGEGGVGGD